MRHPLIALFDSGIGGLHLLKELLQHYPASYLYFADTANMPYGNKSFIEIEHLTKAALDYLSTYKPDCIIVACHTISSTLTSQLKSMISIPIINMVDLITAPAHAATKNGRLGIIGTQATIDSHAHKKSLLSLNPSLYCITQACPALASMIESNPQDEKLASLIDYYLQIFIDQNIDTLLLACTHYEAVKPQIKAILGENIKLIGASEHIVSSIQNQFSFSSASSTSEKQLTIHVSGDRTAFYNSARLILNDISII